MVEAYAVAEPSAVDSVAALLVEHDLLAGREISNLGMVSGS